MATNLRKFESLGGFSVDETVHIDEQHNAMSLNSIEMKNQFYDDSKTTNYILRGANTATLQLDNVGTQITIDSNTVNFITGHFLGVNPAGVVFTGKIESAVYCNAAGATSVLSSMLTIIKDYNHNDSKLFRYLPHGISKIKLSEEEQKFVDQFNETPTDRIYQLS